MDEDLKLTKAELAALDLIIAEMEESGDDKIDPAFVVKVGKAVAKSVVGAVTKKNAVQAGKVVGKAVVADAAVDQVISHVKKANIGFAENQNAEGVELEKKEGNAVNLLEQLLSPEDLASLKDATLEELIELRQKLQHDD